MTHTHALSTPFANTAAYYDAIYAAKGKDYAREAALLLDHARAAGSPGQTLLDVACGTGAHLNAFAARGLDVAGVDASEPMLAMARLKLPHTPLRAADMRAFHLGRRFDVVTCLFASVGYLDSGEELTQAVRAMANHVNERGVLLIEPPLTPERVQAPKRQVIEARVNGTRIRREATATREGNRLLIRFRYEPEGSPAITETHAITLFTPGDFRRAFAHAKLHLDHDPSGPCGHGLYIGTKEY